MGVVGPAKLPEPIVTRLNAEIVALVAEPAVAQRIRTLGSEPAAGTAGSVQGAASQPTSPAGPRSSPTHERIGG